MYSEILARLRTKEEALQLEHEVDLLIESLYKTGGGSFDEALQKHIRGGVANAIKTSLEREKIPKDEFFDGLKNELKKLRVLKLALAFEPSDATIDKIHNWVNNNIGAGVILEFTSSPSILAGAVVIYKGEYRDYSLRSKFKGGFEQSRKKIFEILSK